MQSLSLLPLFAVVLHYESATYAKWQQKYLDLTVRHGNDPEVYARVPFAFYRKSMAAAYAILEARRRRDGAAEAIAVAASRTLWCEHKLEPPGLPRPSARPRRMPKGLTVLWPFAELPHEKSRERLEGGEVTAALLEAAQEQAAQPSEIFKHDAVTTDP